MHPCLPCQRREPALRPVLAPHPRLPPPRLPAVPPVRCRLPPASQRQPPLRGAPRPVSPPEHALDTRHARARADKTYENALCAGWHGGNKARRQQSTAAHKQALQHSGLTSVPSGAASTGASSGSASAIDSSPPRPTAGSYSFTKHGGGTEVSLVKRGGGAALG